jgi:hypothetical protein
VTSARDVARAAGKLALTTLVAAPLVFLGLLWYFRGMPPVDGFAEP